MEKYSSDSSQSTSRRRGLDYRQAPKMEKFKEESSGNIKSFFKKFEEYCRKNIRGGRRFWINALEEHLEGKVADTFAQLRDEEDEYEEAKEKLIRWYKDSAESRRRSHNKKFRNAQPHEDESLYLFSIRLACMYKRAYPRHDVNKSKKLVKQFKKKIPRKVREVLENQIMTRKMEGKKIDWGFVQKCVKFRDNDVDDRDSDSMEERKKSKVREVEINLGQERRTQERDVSKGRTRERSSSMQTEDRKLSRMGMNGEGCFKCGAIGHFARECEKWNEGLCFTCGQSNHFARDCPDKSERRREYVYQTARGGNLNMRGHGNVEQNYRGGYNLNRGGYNLNRDGYTTNRNYSYRGRGRGNFRGGYQNQGYGWSAGDEDQRNGHYGMNQFGTYPNNLQQSDASRQGWANAPVYQPRTSPETTHPGGQISYTSLPTPGNVSQINGVSRDGHKLN